MSSSTRKARQSAAQWQRIIEQQSGSGLSAPQFCAEHDITYQSFMRWRKKLSVDPLRMTATDASPEFVELTTPDDLQPAATANTLWHIELDLAPGVRLRIAR